VPNKVLALAEDIPKAELSSLALSLASKLPCLSPPRERLFHLHSVHLFSCFAGIKFSEIFTLPSDLLALANELTGCEAEVDTARSSGLNKPQFLNWEKNYQKAELVSRTGSRKFSVVLCEVQCLRSASFFFFLLSSSCLIFTVYLTKCITDFDVEFSPVL